MNTYEQAAPRYPWRCTRKKTKREILEMVFGATQSRPPLLELSSPFGGKSSTSVATQLAAERHRTLRSPACSGRWRLPPWA